MKKLVKRIFSLFLALVMMTSVLFGLDFHVYAVEGTDYLSQEDIQYFTNYFLYTLDESTKAMYIDDLTDINHEDSETYWSNVGKAVNMVQDKWGTILKYMPRQLSESQLSQIGSESIKYISSSIEVFKNIDYLGNEDTNMMQKCYHGLKVVGDICGIFDVKLGRLGVALSIFETTFKFGDYLLQVGLQEGLELYKADLALALYAKDELPTPEDVFVAGKVDEKFWNEANALYIEYSLYKMKDDYQNSTNYGSSGEKMNYAGHTYQIFDKSMNWNEAKAFCEELGGHLVTITDSNEQAFVHNMAKQGNKLTYWLGGCDTETEGVWKWVTGEEFNYWNGAGPDNGPPGPEDWLEMIASSGEWNDGELNGQGSSGQWALVNHGIICEWDSYINPYPTMNDEHNYQSTVIAPSCAKDGYTINECVDCGLKYNSNKTDKLGHSYSLTKTVKPTCTAQGYEEYTCSRCNVTEKRNYVNSLDHSYEFTKTVAPTCTAKGYDVYTCSRCNVTEKRNYVNALGHNYTFTKTVAPTCKEQGYDLYTCSRCNTTENRNFTEIVSCDFEFTETIAPTCTEQGYDIYTCSMCKATENRNYVDKLPHNYVFTKVVAPTCTTRGYDLYTCSMCNATDHRNSTGIIAHNYVLTDTIAPTCVLKGYDVYTCTSCNKIYNKNIVASLGHDYIVTEYQGSSCNVTGYKIFTCLRCSDSYQSTVPVLDGSALKAALERAKNCLEAEYYTQESRDMLRLIYEQYKDTPDTLYSQNEVDDTTTIIIEAISNLDILDSASGGTEDGFTWTWDNNTATLSISGEGVMPDYTGTTMPWVDVLLYTTSIEIGEGITSIGEYAFYEAENVQNISLPESLTKISSYVFYGCDSLDNVVIPDNVTYIGGESFADCVGLRSISVPANAVYYGKKSGYTLLNGAFDGSTGIENIIITKGIDGIMPSISKSYGTPVWQAGMFTPWYYAENVSVTLGEGVVEVGDNTFDSCPGLSELNISKTVSNLNIDLGVFYRNYGFKKITVSPDNKNYASFDNCIYSKDMSKLLVYPIGSDKTEFTVPDNVKEIGSSAFNDCDTLEAVNLKQVEKIGAGAFSSCNKLKKILIFNKNCTFEKVPIDKSSTIYGYSGSTAETFANTNSIPFVALADTTNFKVKTVSLSLANNVKMNFKVLKTALAGFEKPYLEVTKNAKVTVIDEYTSQGDYYVFTFKDIAPQTMNDNVRAVLKAENSGIDYESEPYNFSVAKYAYGMLSVYNTDQYAKLRTLLVDLLNYGAAAQLYQGYKTNDLVNSKLTDEQKAWGTSVVPTFKNVSDMKYETVVNPEITWKSVGLQLNSSVAVRYKFTANDINGIKFKVTCEGRVWIYTSADLTYNGDGSYSLWFDGLNADDLQKDIFITAYKGDTAVSNTMRYSVESYAKQVEDYMPNSTLQALTRAMMLYGMSASNYA